MKINISTLVLILFMIVSIILISGVGFIVYDRTKDEIKNLACERLITHAESNAKHIRTFLNNQKINTESIAIAVVFKDLLNADKNQKEYYTDRLTKTRKRLINTLSSNPNYYTNFLADKNGVIIASSNEEEEGNNISETSYFMNGKKGTYLDEISVLNPSEVRVITISSPVMDEGGELLGVYVTKIKLESLINTISGVEFGETGESFIINSEGYMITPSRYQDVKLLNKRVDTISSRDCIEKIEEYRKSNYTKIPVPQKYFETYKDHRGINVLGVYSFIIPEAEWCIITEIDESEALGKPKKEMLETIAFMSGIAILFVWASAYLISKTITKPIEKIQDYVDKITKGDLNIKLDESYLKEVQNLTDSLNRILASMKLAMVRSKISKKYMGIEEAVRTKEEIEEKYKVIVENASEYIFMLDKNYNFTFANKVLLSDFNKKQEEIIGKHISEVFPKEMIKTCLTHMKEVFKYGEQIKYENKFYDGKKYVKIDVILTPLKGRYENVEAIMGIARKK